MERSKEYECEPRVRLVTVEQVELVACEQPPVKSPEDSARLACDLIGAKDREHFLVLHLNSSHQLVSSEVTSIGSLGSTIVHPREVFKGAFLANAAAIVCAHNHPSGDLAPSIEDKAVFERLKDAGKLLGVPMLDFLIVSRTDSWSGREHWTF